MVEECGVLDTDQIRALFFRKLPTGRRKAQERLLKLHRSGKLDRRKVDGVYCYYHERPKMLAHTLGVNWVRVWLTCRLRSWERLHSFAYEQDYGVLRCDALAAIRNTVTGAYSAFLVEFDRGTNRFDKVEKYCKFYQQEGYAGQWWARLVKRFPPALIVTVTPNRAEEIQRAIAEENTTGLEFRVRLLDNIKGEVFGNDHNGMVCETQKAGAGT